MIMVWEFVVFSLVIAGAICFIAKLWFDLKQTREEKKETK